MKQVTLPAPDIHLLLQFLDISVRQLGLAVASDAARIAAILGAAPEVPAPAAAVTADEVA